jgi:hypothetical protein
MVAGVHVQLGKVGVDIKGVEEAQLKVRLGRSAASASSWGRRPARL